MNFVAIYDEYGQPWRIAEGDPLWEAARIAVQSAGPTGAVVWPLKKINENRGWGWWTVFVSLDELEAGLTGTQGIPNPGVTGPIALNREFNPTELQDMLQAFGSHASRLMAHEGRLRAQLIGLSLGFKNAMTIAIQQVDGSTLRDKEAIIMSSQDIFRDTKKLEIETEAKLAMVEGWRKSYEKAWETISRIISLRIGETGLQTGRHP